ncbi:MAG: membrane protein insertase YidC, partial [Fidelibacterota bacterium]
MDKKTVLAFIIIAVVLILTPYYLKLISPPQEPKSISPTTDTLKTFMNREAIITPEEFAEKKTIPGEKLPFSAYPKEDILEYTIDTELYTARISSRGGGSIINWTLKKFKGPYEEPLRFIESDENPNMNVIFITMENDTINTGYYNFYVDPSLRGTVVLGPDKPKQTINFKLSLNSDKYIEKELTFYNDSYSIDLKISLINLDEVIANREYNLSWMTPLSATEKDVNEDMNYTKAYVLVGDEIEDVDAKSNKTKVKAFVGTTHWTAVRTKYFLSAIIPVNKKGNGSILKG